MGLLTCRCGIRLATSCSQATVTAATADSLDVLLQLGPVQSKTHALHCMQL